MVNELVFVLTLTLEFDSQQLIQLFLAFVGNTHRSGRADTRHPLQFKESLEQGDSQGACKMVPPLGPVEALAGQAARARSDFLKIDPQLFKPEFSVGCNAIAL